MDDSAREAVPPFEEIVARYEKPVFLRIRERVGDSEVAEDLTQETFVSAYRSRDLLTANTDIQQWLFGIADSWCGPREPS